VQPRSASSGRTSPRARVIVERKIPDQQASTSWVTPWRRCTRVASSRSTRPPTGAARARPGAARSARRRPLRPPQRRRTRLLPGQQWRGLATRYDKHARNYVGALSLAALLTWLPRSVGHASLGDQHRAAGYLSPLEPVKHVERVGQR
jgi:hypothetical protein